MPADPVLRCQDLGVTYAGVRALSGVDLGVAANEVVALLGPSGSGKSTLLHAVAGIVAPSAGEIWLAGHRVADRRSSVPPERRAVGMVFQNFALWPHLCVLDTVAYPMRRAGWSRSAARAAAIELLDRLGIGYVADRRPAELSGGEQQRVGLARALARNARLYLLDEPTAHLDTHLREAFQAEVLARCVDTGAAAVYATHDAAEALRLADRVALIDGGRLVQFASPQTVYAEPVSETAAALTGPGSVLSATVRAAGPDRLGVDLGTGELTVLGGGAVPGAPRPARLLLRPDWVRPDWLGDDGPVPGRVAAVGFRGTHTDYHVDSPAGRVLMQHAGPPMRAVGDPVRWDIHRAWVLGPGDASAEGDDGAGLVQPVVDDVEV
jgi:ABC-type Fe3+/spermidine/putrescine transport system ATPase subunit